MPERVLVLHGFGAPGWCVLPLVYRLRRYGFNAERWTYPSFTRPIDSIAHDLSCYIKAMPADDVLHLVAHSMGSVVIRAMLTDIDPDRFGRIVFLAPPIAGAPLADLAPRFVHRMFPPLSQLASDPDGYIQSLPLPSPDRLAVIAARFDLHVPPRRTRAPSIRYHLTLNLTHNGLLVSRRAAAATSSFLLAGSLESKKKVSGLFSVC